YNGNHHYISLEPLITVADGQVAESSAAHHPGHGGIGHQGNGDHGDRSNDAGARLRQQGAGDDLRRDGADGLGRLGEAPIHFAQGGFHQTGEEGGGTHHQRRNGAGHAQGGAGNQLGHRDHHDQQ